MHARAHEISRTTAITLANADALLEMAAKCLGLDDDEAEKLVRVYLTTPIDVHMKDMLKMYWPEEAPAL
jgi:hypothetical protein